MLGDFSEARRQAPSAKEQKPYNRRLRISRNRASGRRASYGGRSMTERTCGHHTSENVGMSSERKVRILPAENLRVPEEGSSPQG